jgi:hypothetical protein
MQTKKKAPPRQSQKPSRSQPTKIDEFKTERHGRGCCPDQLGWG